jgi:hypothetical protein
MPNAETQRKAREREARRRRRVRLIATGIVLAGVLSAGYVYWLGVYRAGPSVEDLLPGSERLTQRQVGMLYGHGGQIVYDWIQDAKSPAGKASLLVAGAVATAVLYARFALGSQTPDHRA